MKFLHCADLHLDAALRSGLPAEKARERRSELLSAFTRLADAATNCGAAAVIIAGDLFDRSAVTLRTRRFVTETIASHPSVDFLLLPGNHDGRRFELGESLPENLKLFGEDWTSFEYGDVFITGATVCDPASLSLDQSRVNVVVLHGADGQDFKLRELKNRGIDYLALGHYHSFSETKIDRRGVACYSGCLEGRGFDECGEKGYVLLDFDGKKLSHEFVPCSDRVVSIIDVDLTEGKSLNSQRELILSSLDGVDRRGMVRVNVVGNYELGRENYFDTITRELEREFFHFEISDSSILYIDPADYKNDVSLKGEFIRLCMKEISDEAERSRVISCGIRALRGEELL